MMRTKPNILIGLILILLGVLFLLDNMGYIDAGDVVAHFWPLVLVLVGISLLMKGRRMETIHASPPPVAAEGPPQARRPSVTTPSIVQSEIFGDVLLSVSSQEFTGGSASTVFGDVRLDLKDVRLKEGEQLLRISTLFGDSKIDIPDGMEFSVQASTVFGDIKVKGIKRSGFAPSLFYKSPGYDGALRKLTISISQLFGDTRIY